MTKVKNNKPSKWKPPKNYRYYFDPDSDAEFKAEHPIGYKFLLALGIVALVLPMYAFILCVGLLKGEGNGWEVLGAIGGFIFGIGLFNFVAIIIKQYLGHWVSIICFLLGGGLMALSWFLC
ncbi:MAG: hypothetical protein IJF80_06230 [Clostridia bacterium]|nr:hypothetical protein [Clostridia bacterium]